MTDPWLDVRIGDNRVVLDTLPDESVHCCVTSPPYWGLRDYGHGDQLGLEATPEEYVENMVGVFRKVRRVLRDDGTLWLNLGDSYGGDKSGGRNDVDRKYGKDSAAKTRLAAKSGLKPKDLVGIPWRVAFALQADGWYLRSDIIWAKPNPMPESVTDRPTKAHEYLFLLAKSERYYFDQEAVREGFADERMGNPGRYRWAYGEATGKGAGDSSLLGADGVVQGWNEDGSAAGRNIRTVWTIPKRPYPGAHFAVFPPDLVEPCIKAGCPEGGTVLDPFGGSGTVGMVANKLSRRAVLIELNPEYGEQIEKRNAQTVMGLTE